MTNHKLSEHFRQNLNQFWRSNQQIGTASRLIMGVSGGADSLALWHWLLHEAPYPSNQILAVYIDHGLRPAAREDVLFLKELANRWRVDFIWEHVDTFVAVEQHRLTIEEAARILRYRRLGRLAEKSNAPYVLVGHHADDQVETILQNLIRGSGLAGLRGMKRISAWPVEGFESIRLVRPLLDCSRAAVEAYLSEIGLSPRVDETNDDLAFLRNRIRHELIPLLTDYNSNIKTRLLNLADQATADYELVEASIDRAWQTVVLAATEQWVRLDLTNWSAQTLGLRRHLLRRVHWTLLGHLRDFSFDQLEQARETLETATTGNIVGVGPALNAHIYYGQIIVTAGKVNAAFDLPQTTDKLPIIPLAIPCEVGLLNGWLLRVEQTDQPLQKPIPHSNRWAATLCVPEEASLFLRSREVGEQFIPSNFEGHTVALKRFMINEKIPAPLRANWPLVADMQGLLWIIGYRVAERATVRTSRPPAGMRYISVICERSEQ